MNICKEIDCINTSMFECITINFTDGTSVIFKYSNSNLQKYLKYSKFGIHDNYVNILFVLLFVTATPDFRNNDDVVIPFNDILPLIFERMFNRLSEEKINPPILDFSKVNQELRYYHK